MPTLSRLEKVTKERLAHSDNEMAGRRQEICPICSQKYIRLPRTIRSKAELECGHHCCRQCACKTTNCAICERESTIPLSLSTCTSDNSGTPSQTDCSTHGALDVVVDSRKVVFNLSSASAESGVDRCVRADTVSNRAADTRTRSGRSQWYATDTEDSAADDDGTNLAPNDDHSILHRVTTVAESEPVPTVPLSQVSTVVGSTVAEPDSKIVLMNDPMVPKIVSFIVPVSDNYVSTDQDRASRKAMRKADRESEKKIRTDGEYETQRVKDKVNEKELQLYSHLTSLAESGVASFSDSLKGLRRCVRVALGEGHLVKELLNMLHTSSNVESWSIDVVRRSEETIRTESSALLSAIEEATEAVQKLARVAKRSKTAMLAVVEECGFENHLIDDSIRRAQEYDDERELSYLDDGISASNSRESVVKEETVGGRSVHSTSSPNEVSTDCIPSAHHQRLPAFEIFVEDNEQQRIHIECTPNNTVYELKEGVKHAAPSLPIDMTLTYDGTVLENDRTLSYYSIPHNAVVNYVNKPVVTSSKSCNYEEYDR